MEDTNNITTNGSVQSQNALMSSHNTRSSLLDDVTNYTLANMTKSELLDIEKTKARVFEECKAQILLENVNRSKGEKLKMLDELMPGQIADIILKAYDIVCIHSDYGDNSREYDLLAIYQIDGEDKGTYSTERVKFNNLVRKCNYEADSRTIEEVIRILYDKAPIVSPCDVPYLVPVNNGIFNYDTKELMPFDPKYIFLTKSHVNYNPNATNVIIHNPDDNTDWDVESWMRELSSSPDVVELLWQILGAIIRPNVKWNKSAWFYSESGNNGKGTLCELMRQLCGKGAYASVSLSDMSKEFGLESLTHASAIIVDENDVGVYIDKAANLKALITGDILRINRKFKKAVSFRFRGFMVQCLNEMPRIKDKTDSFFRRQLFVPFEKSFTGHERKYIKDDYLHRQEVLEYVMFKVLHEMNYYTLSEPEVCKNALEEYREYNDTIRQFANDILKSATWDLLPDDFLYDLYKSWMDKNQPHGMQEGKTSFLKDFRAVLPHYPEWTTEKGKRYRTGLRMARAEFLIEQYQLTDWMSPLFRGNERVTWQQRCTPTRGQFRDRYYGIIRSNIQDDDSDTQDDDSNIQVDNPYGRNDDE